MLKRQLLFRIYGQVEKRTFNTVVCDFGVSAFTATAVTQNNANAGTIAYQHKDSLTGRRANAAMDVYALGCIALELYALKRVWEDVMGPAQLVSKILMNEYPDSTRLSKYPTVLEIVDACFKEPDSRISMVEMAKRFSALFDHDEYC